MIFILFWTTKSPPLASILKNKNHKSTKNGVI
uniref:Uncharacterized protein n=1 Tax=Arundo donax TaxID=35708 RepID=A0A0A9AF67_ARUDO